MRGKSTKVAIEPPLSPASNEAPLSPMTLETAREVTHAMRQAGEAAPLFGDAFPREHGRLWRACSLVVGMVRHNSNPNPNPNPNPTVARSSWAW